MNARKHIHFILTTSLFAGLLVPLALNKETIVNKASAAEKQGSITSNFTTTAGSGDYNHILTSDFEGLYNVDGHSSSAGNEHGLVPGNWGASIAVQERSFLVYQIAPGNEIKSLSLSLNVLLRAIDDNEYYWRNYFDVYVGNNPDTIMDGNPKHRYSIADHADYGDDIEEVVGDASEARTFNLDLFDTSLSGQSTLYVAVAMNSAASCSDDHKSSDPAYMDGDNIKLEFIGTKIYSIGLNYTYEESDDPDPDPQSSYSVSYTLNEVSLTEHPQSIESGQSVATVAAVTNPNAYIAYVRQNNVYEDIDPNIKNYGFNIGGSGISQNTVVAADVYYKGNEINTTEYSHTFAGEEKGNFSWVNDAYDFNNLRILKDGDDDTGHGLSLGTTGDAEASGYVIYRMVAPKDNSYSSFSIMSKARIADFGDHSARLEYYVSTDGSNYTLLKSFEKNESQIRTDLSYPSADDDPVVYEQGVEEIFIKIQLVGQATMDWVSLKELSIILTLKDLPPETTQSYYNKVKDTGDILLQIDYKERELTKVTVDGEVVDPSYYYTDVNTLALKGELIDSLEAGEHVIEAFTTGGSVKYTIDVINKPAPNTVNDVTVIAIIIISVSSVVIASVVIGIVASHRVKIKKK